MSKILWFDTETTGLDPNRNGLIQLAMVMDVDGEAVDTAYFEFQPFQNDYIDIGGKMPTQWLTYDLGSNGTLPITEITIQTLFSYPLPSTAKINTFLQKHISKFDKTDKAYVGGYNVPFDRAFLSKFYEKCGDKYLGSYINWKQLDVLSMLYLADFHGKIKLENYKLETACKYFNIELEAHNPMSDIKATREIFYKLEGDENDSSEEELAKIASGMDEWGRGSNSNE